MRLRWWSCARIALFVAASCSSGVLTPDGGLDASLDVNDSGMAFDIAADSHTCNQLHCSADLHDVVCEDGVVATHCPLDQGCAGAICVPACTAAAANHGTVGCEYWAMYPDIFAPDYGDCFAIFVTNAWGSPITLQGDFDNTPLTNIAAATRLTSGAGKALSYTSLPADQLPAGAVGIIFVASTPQAAVRCPTGIQPLLATDPATHGTGIGHAIHLTTSAPVVAYQIVPYGGGASAVTSATLLLPVPSWGKNYIGVDAYSNHEPWLAIVASADNTQVSLSPTSAVTAANGIPAIAANAVGTITLQKGQYAQLNEPDGSELTGTIIQSNNPVAVFGGSTCMNIPNNMAACDSAHQQIPPIASLGHEYVGVRYRDRFSGVPETTPWRLVGAVDGTSLTWEPARPSTAPTSLAAGQMAEFSTGSPFVVRSQDANHPFYIAQYMTGGSVYAGTSSEGRGDPEFVNVVPPEQFLTSYTFFTDPTYSETELVIVRAKGTSGFADVTLDCAGTLTGWTPVGSQGDYEVVRRDLVTGNFASVSGCNNGRHTMSSNGSFGVTVWGWGSAATGGQFGCDACTGFFTQWVSYAYPVGASVQSLNSVVVIPTPQ